MKYRNIYITGILITVLLVMLLSCNLQGEGIFQSISRASEADSPELYRSTAEGILGTDNDYTYAYASGGVLSAFKDNVWTTLKSNLPKNVVISTIVMDDNDDFYALAFNSSSDAQEIYKGTADVDNKTITWTIEAVNYNDETIASLGILGGKPYVVTHENDGTDLKVRVYHDEIDEAPKATIDDFSDDAELSDVFSESEGEYLIINVYDKKDTFKTIILNSNSNIMVIDDNDLKDSLKITGAMFHNDGTDDFLYVTAYDMDEKKHHFFKGKINGNIDFTENTPGTFRLRTSGRTPMTIIDDDTLVIGGHRGLYVTPLDNLDNLREPAVTAAQPYYGNIKEKRINSIYQKDGAGTFNFYLASTDYWVLKVEGKDNHSSRL